MLKHVEDCVVTRFKFKGQTFYLMTGETFVDVTCPYENREDMLAVRLAMNAICEAISEQRVKAVKERQLLKEQLAMATLAKECKT